MARAASGCGKVDPEARMNEPGVTFVISVAADLAGMHPQTLRQYDRLGLVIPQRTKGRGRRYSSGDVHRLRRIQALSQDEGINLEGIRRILDLERQVERLEAEASAMRARLADVEERRNRIFAATPSGEVHPLRRGQRSGVEAMAADALSRERGRVPGPAEMVVWRGLRPPVDVPAGRRVRAVIEAGPARGNQAPSVRVLEGTVRVL